MNFLEEKRKIYADYYIDDKNIGVPLVGGTLDWIKIKKDLEKKISGE